jgi:hypothetical protein
MKIITILLLMISTQAQAQTLGVDADGDLTETLFTVEQCNQIANVSKRTIKAAISGVPIAEVIEKFIMTSRFDTNTGQERELDIQQADEYADTSAGRAIDNVLNANTDTEEKIGDADAEPPWSIQGGNAITDDYYMGGRITAIYKTVDQIKTKYGQVRPQDRVRLNNRVEQKLLECRKTAYTGQIGIE